MKNVFSYGLIALAVIVLAVVLYREAGKAGKEESGDGLKVAATIFPLADIVKNVGGEKVEVVTILPAGASPHVFEVKPATVRALSGSRAIFMIGHHLDEWVAQIGPAVRGDIRLVEVHEGIKLRTFEDGSEDPHYWLSIPNARTIAKNVAAELSSLLPQESDYFAANLESYIKELDAADKEIRSLLAGLEGRPIATFHEAWFYFAEEYGVDIAEAFEPYPGKQPSPAFIAQFSQTIRQENISHIFTEPQFSDAAIRQLARDLNVELGVLDPVGGAGPHGTYIDMMVQNARTLREALGQ